MHIGISGPIAAGKSTLAKSLQAVFDLIDIKTRIVPFAEDVKWMASLYGDTEIIPKLRIYLRKMNYDELTVAHGIAEVLYAFMLYPPVEGVKPRKLYQHIGTEAGRYTVDNDLWVKSVQARIKGDTYNTYFISDDVRFPNEALALDYHVRIALTSDAATEAYNARKALYPSEYFYNDHDSETETLPTPHYTIPTNFTTVEVIHLAKTINHFARKAIILTQNDLYSGFGKALQEFGTGTSGVTAAMKKIQP